MPYLECRRDPKSTSLTIVFTERVTETRRVSVEHPPLSDLLQEEPKDLTSDPAFLSGGEMGERIRAFDRSKTPRRTCGIFCAVTEDIQRALNQRRLCNSSSIGGTDD